MIFLRNGRYFEAAVNPLSAGRKRHWNFTETQKLILKPKLKLLSVHKVDVHDDGPAHRFRNYDDDELPFPKAIFWKNKRGQGTIYWNHYMGASLKPTGHHDAISAEPGPGQRHVIHPFPAHVIRGGS